MSATPLALPRALLADEPRRRELVRAAIEWPSLELSPRQLCDVELLSNGAFWPLDGFMTCAQVGSVCAGSRLPDGQLWPLPITLDVAADLAARADVGRPLALRDSEGTLVAVLEVREAWRPDRRAEALAVFGTDSVEHPGVAAHLDPERPLRLAGSIEGVQLPPREAPLSLRPTPAELREELRARGWPRVVAFQTRNPMHFAHVELCRRAMRLADARLLLHPVTGPTRDGDLDAQTRLRCYQAVLPLFAENSARLALLPLAMRLAGPREALLHGIVRRNYGCTHLIVGRDHAGPGADKRGRPFYPPYAAQELFRRHERELGITLLAFREMVYLKDARRYVPEDEVPPGAAVETLAGTELRRKLAGGEAIPRWFTPDAVAAELTRAFQPPRTRGLTILLSGLPGSGKSTLARALRAALEARGRRVTLLDGDAVRRSLAPQLGFSREDRDQNVRRVGSMAAEVARLGGTALCALIAPYDAARREARQMAEAVGGFVLVHVATPLEVCEQRDGKGLYARARAGRLAGFTGVSDPYETPPDAELIVDMSRLAPEDGASRIIERLARDGHLPDQPTDDRP